MMKGDSDPLQRRPLEIRLGYMRGMLQRAAQKVAI